MTAQPTCSRPGCNNKPKLVRAGLCRAHAEARGQRRIPAHIIRNHINECVESGWQASAVGDAAGVGSGRISHIMSGKCDHVYRATADAILAVQPHRVTSGWHPATGASRRCQALAAAGWSRQCIADLFNINIATVSHLMNERVDTVKIATHQRITDAYRHAENAPPSTKVDARIARRGWPLPAEWDGLDIDNPDQHPHTTQTARVDTYDPIVVERLHNQIIAAEGNKRALRGHHTRLPPEHRTRTAQALKTRGHSNTSIATVLGLTTTQLAPYLTGGTP